MILSRTAEYALRIAAFLALQTQKQEPFRGKDLAAAANVPPHYASKILRRLVKAGLLKAVRGHRGGFVLAKSAARIRFIDILVIIEGPLEARTCVFGLKACSDKRPCPLHFRWKALAKSFHDWAETTTLADIQHDVGMKRAGGQFNI